MGEDANWFRNKVGGRGRQTESIPVLCYQLPVSHSPDLICPDCSFGVLRDTVNTQYTGNNGSVHCSSGVALPTQYTPDRYKVVPGPGANNQ